LIRDNSGQRIALAGGSHFLCMTTYTIIPKVDHTGFHVAIVCTDGVRQTILGFQTQADAEAWVSRDEWQSAAERRLIRLNQRTEQVLRDYSC
jgi:hypothetical protein